MTKRQIAAEKKTAHNSGRPHLELHKITGEFSAVDQKLSLQFSTRTGQAQTAEIPLTGC